MLVQVLMFLFIQPDFNINYKSHAKVLYISTLNSKSYDSVPLIVVYNNKKKKM